MDKAAIKSLEELQAKFGNNFEIVVRMKDGKYKEFTKVLLAKAKDSSNEEAIKKICKQTTNLLKNTEKMNKAINTIKGLEVFNSVIGVMNLCSTTAGFIIVCQKLNKISEQVQNVMNTIKDIYHGETMYKFDNVIEEHTKMLDGKEGGIAFTEKDYLDLIIKENTLVKLLYKIFCDETSSNRMEILEAIIALSSMMAVAICEYDSIYRYEHKEKKSLFSGHDAWMETYNMILNSEFVKSLQDFFFINEDLTQYETDILVEGVTERFEMAKEAIEVKDEFLKLIDTKEEYDNAIKVINDSISEDISSLIQTKEYQNDKQVLALCKEAQQAVGMYS